MDNKKHTEHAIDSLISATSNLRNVPADFLKSDVAQQALVHCTDSILQTTETQDEIDNMYSHVCNLYYSEMDNWFRSNNINSKSCKKFRNSSKPYWSVTNNTNTVLNIWKSEFNELYK